MGKGKNLGAGRNGGGGGGGSYVYIHFSTNPQPESSKKKANKQTEISLEQHTVIKLILDRRSCEKLHKKLGLPARFSWLQVYVQQGYM